MKLPGRLSFAGLVLVGAGVLAASFLAKPFVPAAMAADSDGDGLSDALENALGSNPNAANSDADGWNDWQEAFVHGTVLVMPDSDFDGTFDDLDSCRM